MHAITFRWLFAAATTLTTACPAQATDVGLTMSGGMLTVIWGQDCGPVDCSPMFGGLVGDDRLNAMASSALCGIASGPVRVPVASEGL